MSSWMTADYFAGEQRLCLPSQRAPSFVAISFLRELFFDIFVAIVPTLIFFFFAPFNFHRLRKQPIKVVPNYRGICKLFIAVVLAFLNLTTLVLEIKTGSHPPYLYSAAGSFAAGLIIPYLSFINHSRSQRPFDLLNGVLTLSLSRDLLQVLLLRYIDQCRISIPSEATIIAKIVLLILELQSKRSILREPWQGLSFEETESNFSQSFFWWVNSLLRRGRYELFEVEDLPPLPRDLSSQLLREKMKHYWEIRSKPERRFELALALMKCTFWENIRVVPFMLAAMCLQYAQPVLISQLIRFVSVPHPDQRDLRGYGLILLTFKIYVGLAVLKGRRDIAQRRVTTVSKGSLMSLIHHKSLISGNDSNHSAITLIGNDVEDVQRAMQWFHVIWSSIISFGVGLYLLSFQLGWASVVPVILVFITSQGGKYVSKNFVSKQRAWSDATQTRISLIRTVLGHLKSIKMGGYSQKIEEKIQEARKTELNAGLTTYWLDVLLAGCASFLNVVGPAITLGVYTVVAKYTGNPPLDTERVFTSFGLIQMVTLPVNSMLFIIPNFIAAIAGFDRIQKFLLEPTHENKHLDLTHQTVIDQEPVDLLNQDLADITNPSGGGGGGGGYAIKFQDVSVRFDTEDRPVLNKIDFEIEAGWIVMIKGITGSGKTTLARTIIGDLQPESGSISTSSRKMAFCSQSPWLPNGTIRDLIAGPPASKITDEKWYQRVLFACDLEDDLAQLPNGDETLVGGTSLSGGQKQRVAVARAIYSRLDILVLDDVFSALDARTANRVAQRLIGPSGLLRELKKTVVLITHSNTDGSISQKGTWSQLKSEDSPTDTETEEESSLQNSSDVAQEEKPIEDSSLATSKPKRSMDSVRQIGDSAIYQYYIKAIGASRIMATIAILMSAAVFTMLIQNWLRLWTANVDKNGDQRTWFYLIIYLLLALGHWLSLTGMATVSLLVVPTSGQNLHNNLIRTVINAPLSFITSTDMVATTLSRFSQDMKQVDRQLPGQIAALGSQIFKLIAQVLLLFMAQAYFLLTLPFLIIIVYVIQKIYLFTSRQLRWLSMEANSLPNTNFLETVHGITTIRAFGWENEYALDNSKAIDTSQVPSYTLLAIEQWLTLVLDLIVAAVAVFNVVLIVTQSDNGSISAGQVGIIMNVILSVNIVLFVAVQSWANFDASLGVISRIKGFSSTVLPEPQSEETISPSDSWPAKGAVEFENVVADYSTASDTDSESTVSTYHAINHISLKLTPGQKIGICGRTGSGKSSLLLSILRLIDPMTGSITIDGLDLTAVSRETLRSRIITIPQDLFIITSDSIHDNLDILKNNSSEEVLIALEKVHLRSLLDTRAAYKGFTPEQYLDVRMEDWTLSQGQMQLFSLARALLLRSSRGRLVLLDEATGNVDQETDKWVQQIVREEFQGYTTIVVAHRLETIADADSIVVMNQGKVVETGSFNELWQKEDSFFRSIFDSNGP
ncbi:P-loop containing nucleoside triphosphate hydrolase protein [Penicillium angulare]|uniref:P-loop containing nucleoside triphosphate hydrolase protein n=1 Tax=Penicillium angulare TaxID=116970 RepID=A0A9W9F6D7_9EURO|nr:P-loop containing nucleoside triphosphate hydrolase protein [Penicillium angulare]